MVKKIVLGVLLLAAIAGAVYLFWPESEIDKIKQQFNLLADKASRKPDKGKIPNIGSGGIGNLIDDPCEFDTQSSYFGGKMSPSQFTSKVTVAKTMVTKATVKFYDLKIELKSETEAQAVFTAHINGAGKTGNSFREVREINASLVKKRGKWLFTRFKVITVLKK